MNNFCYSSVSALLHQVSEEGQDGKVTGTLDSRSDATLIFQAVARNTTRQQFALFVNELKKEVRILVVNVFDAVFAETAIFFATQTDFRVAEEFYIFS